MGKKSKYDRGGPRAQPGRIDEWPVGYPPLEDVALKAVYCGSGKHKTYTAPNHEWEPVWSGDADVGRCDKYREDEWHRISTTLKDAIRSGCVQVDVNIPEFPTRVWAYVNDVLHEARLTNQSTGEYHGFPLRKGTKGPMDRYSKLKEAPRVTIPTDR
jgi:hypothetical protein